MKANRQDAFWIFGLAIIALLGWNAGPGLAQPAGMTVPGPLQSQLTPGSDQMRDWDPWLGMRLKWAEGTPWRVYADREDVEVFFGPDPRTSRRREDVTIQFGDAFYVFGQDRTQKTLYLVRSDSKPNESTIGIREHIGWVPAEQLVLSNEAAREANWVSKKAFVVNLWSHFADGDYALEELQRLTVNARSAPSPRAQVRNTITGVADRFSYIYKRSGPDEENGWLLVGTTRDFLGDNAKKVLLGWIPASRVIQWNSREALEPDPERSAPAHVYESREILLSSRQQSVETLWDDQMSLTPLGARDWRSPVLGPGDRAGDEYARIAFLGPVVYAGSDREVSPDSFLNAVNDIYDTLSKVNIILVMDATLSMGPYLDGAAEVLIDVMHSMGSAPSPLGLRFGAVVYRDYDDSVEERFPCVQQLTTDQETVSEFLTDQRIPSNRSDRDYEEALYGGIERALELAADEQTNILLVMGDAGNNEQKDAREDGRRRGSGGTWSRLERLIQRKQPIIMAVHLDREPNGDLEREAMGAFEPDVQRVLTIVDEERARLTRAFNTKVSGSRLVIPPIHATSFERTASGNRESIADAARRTEAKVAEIVQKNAEALDELRLCIENPANCLARGGEGSTGGAVPYTSKGLIYDAIIRTVKDPVLAEAIANYHVQVCQEGWVWLRTGTGRLMEPVLLVSVDELYKSKYLMEELLRDTPGDFEEGSRTLLQNLIELLKGEDAPNLDALVSWSGGISPRAESENCLLKYPVDKLTNLTDDQRRALYECILTTVDRLDALLQDESRSFRVFGSRYLWVKLKELP